MTKNPSLKVGLALLLMLGVVYRANSQELSFASRSEARVLLSTKDAFVSRMSPFDRSARMQTDREVSESEFLEFAASAAMEWKPREIDVVRAAFAKIQPAIMSLRLPLPERIQVIKTSGREEGNAAYTRANAIILPRDMISSPESELERLLAHELFHIASRQHPALATRLYETIGFHPCGEVVLPPDLARRKITNPDAPKNDYCINVRLGRDSVMSVPILLSRTANYDVSRGGQFFDYLQLMFLLVAPDPNSASPRIVYRGEAPRMVPLQDVSGFYEQVGQNTDYLIHPEEILADNFALLVLGVRDVRSPNVLSRMRDVLAGRSPHSGRGTI